MNLTFPLPTLTGLGIYNSDSISRARGSVSNPRTTVWYELELPTDDGGTSFIDGAEFPIRRDHLLCIHPGQERYTRFPFRCYYVHFSAEGELCGMLDNLPPRIQMSDVKHAERLFHDIINAAGGSDEDKLIIHSRLLELIWLIRADSRRTSVTSFPDSELIAAALDYIDRHIDQPITLESLAASQHVSPVYFHRLFKNAVGVTPYRFILDKKLSIAKNQLLMTSKSCLDIALGLGFTSQSYFNYTFRKEVGVSPLQYRKRWYMKYPE
ncbi:MAG: helix-turn-helix transcriptional regulator [Clostridia bacterium]|nr:helix-turn-helix transcriptional regulator [Clostridia bacterium]